MIGLLAAGACVVAALVLARFARRLVWALDRAQFARADEDIETEYRIRDWRNLPTPDSERILPLIRRRERVSA